MEWKQQLHKSLKRDEGIRLKAYLCTNNKWTIGFGHTKGVKKGDVLALHDAEGLLLIDMEEAIASARKVFDGFDKLDGPRKAVLANMAFNLGARGLAGFKRMLSALRAGDYNSAALHMLDSKWKVQVGQRAQRLAKQMSTGEYQ